MSVMQWQQLLQARTGQVPPASAALFLGNLDWACEEEWLREENITVIWNCVERHSGFQYHVLPRRRELLGQVLPGIQWCEWSPASEHQRDKVEDFVLRLSERLLEGQRVVLMDATLCLNAAAAVVWALYALGASTLGRMRTSGCTGAGRRGWARGAIISGLRTRWRGGCSRSGDG